MVAELSPTVAFIFGATGAAGEISHAPTENHSAIPSSCRTTNCLESAASGAAIVARLREEEIEVENTEDVIALCRRGDPLALDLLRESGRLVGKALSRLVNFFNPHAVFFGGSLSAADPFVAAVRGVVFQRCLPTATNVLDVRLGSFGPDGEAHGGIQLILESVIDAESIDQLIARQSLGIPGDARISTSSA